MDKKVTLSISLLISNRLDTIAKCLNSLEPIRQALPSELILVDTSRNPAVHKLLQRYTDHIISFDWCNDFAKARNAGLKEASGEWFLYLDDDEWFTDSDAIIRFFTSGQYKEFGEACYVQRNYLDMEGLQYSDCWVSRMFRLTQDTHFVSKIHEYVEPVEGDRMALESIVDHYGYVFEDTEKALAHYERNTSLLLEMITEQPQNLRWRMELAQEYFLAEKYSELYELGRESLSICHEKSDINEKVAIQTFYASMILGLEYEEKYDQMLEVCKSADSDARALDLLQAFVALHRADIYVQLYNYKDAESDMQHYFEKKEYFEEHLAELMIQKTAPLVGSCFDGLKLLRAYSIRICIGLGQHRIDELERYLDALHWEQNTVYVYDGIMSHLIDGMNAMPDEAIWKRVFRLLYQNGLLWNYFCAAYMEKTQNKGVEAVIATHCCTEEVQAYCKMKEAESKLLSGVACKGDYARERQLLNEYAIYTVVFHELHNRSAETEENLPSGYQGAKLLVEALEAETENPTKFLSLLGECVKVDSVLAEPIKKYITLYQDHMNDVESAQKNELKELARQIKAQVRGFIKVNDIDNAKAILEQLKAMIPNDAEVTEMLEKIEKKEVVLSIGLLVSNRKDTIKKCLDSLEPIRKAIPCQLIITDMGCDAQVRSILNSYADTMTEFVWCSDFAKARNANLCQAKGEWYLYLDDDEWFGDTNELIDFFVSGAYKEYDGACYVQRNYENKEGSIYSDDYVSRMVRLDPKRHFVGKIHEYLVPIPEKNCPLGSWVHHYGYVFKNKTEIQSHYERNSKLLLEMIEEEPENQRWWTYLAQEYLSVQDGDKLYKLAQDGLNLVEHLDDVDSNISRGTFYMCAIMACKCKRDNEQEYKECEKTIADSRNTKLCVAYAKWWKAHCCTRRGKYEEAEKYLNEYLEDLAYFKSHKKEYMIQKEAPIVGQCYDEIKLTEAYEMLIMVGLKQNNVSYLARFLDVLPWKDGTPYVCDGFMKFMVEAMTVMDEKELFMRTIQTIHSNADVWRIFCKEIVVLKGEKKFRVDNMMELCRMTGHEEGIVHFEEWYKIENAFINGISAISYPDYKTWFVGFSEHVIGFYKDVYGIGFDDQTELSGACLMAMMIRDAMECEDNKENFIQTMKQCPGVYPQLTNQVKMLLTLYLREPLRKEWEVKAELRKLKEQVLEQAKQLQEAGQYNAASQILDQLKQMVPNDVDVMALDLQVHLQVLEHIASGN